MSLARPVGLLLAAGKSSRFRRAAGGDKLLCAVPPGLPRQGLAVVLASLAPLREALDQVHAVVDRDNAAVGDLLRDAGCPVLMVDSDGIGRSIALGVGRTAEAGGWLIALADMPFIRAETIAAVAAALAEATLVVPCHQGRRGHPVGFGRRFGPSLAALGGDQGARDLMKDHPPLDLELGDPGILLDIDHPNDWSVAALIPPLAPPG